MKNNSIIFILISLIVGVVCYLALDNIYISVGVLALYLIVGLFIFSKMIERYQVKTRKFHECYHFINNFIISLSIKKSISGSIESTINSMPNDFIDIYEGLENMTDKEKLNYLATYFPFHAYQLFLQIVDIWEDEGGDILQMSKYLINEISNNEEYITKSDSIASHKYVEIGILWAFCLVIIVILRFALNDFYASIKSQLLYMISIVIVFVFILVNIYLLIKKGTELEIKGYSENEKNISSKN